MIPNRPVLMQNPPAIKLVTPVVTPRRKPFRNTAVAISIAVASIMGSGVVQSCADFIAPPADAVFDTTGYHSIATKKKVAVNDTLNLGAIKIIPTKVLMSNFGSVNLTILDSNNKVEKTANFEIGSSMKSVDPNHIVRCDSVQIHPDSATLTVFKKN